MASRFDAIIIGTGQAGPTLASRLSQAGMEVAIIERQHFGGTCVNNGCTPTKALVANAKAAHCVRNAATFGIQIDHFFIDMKQVKARKDDLVKQSSAGVEKWLKSLPGCRVFHGHAVLDSPHSVYVNQEILETSKIFINVGGRAMIPNIPGLDKIPYLTNSSMMELDHLPDHLVIMGGGYIALEFAQMYRRFGSQVTVLQKHPFLMPNEDLDVSIAIRHILEKEGIKILTEFLPRLILPNSGSQKIHLEGEYKGQKMVVSGSHLLLAIGRIPNTADLGLEKAGVEKDAKGFIKVDAQLRTTQPHIWALGDCNGKGAFTHTAYNDYEIVAQNLLENANRKVSDRIPIYALFIDPPLGRVGMTERQAKESGKNVLIATLPMTRVARAREKGETEGFMKILVDDDSKQILGASLLGVDCDEVVQLIADVIYAKAPYTTIKKGVHIHPTVAELIPTLLEDLKTLNTPVSSGA